MRMLSKPVSACSHMDTKGAKSVRFHKHKMNVLRMLPAKLVYNYSQALRVRFWRKCSHVNKEALDQHTHFPELKLQLTIKL